MKVLVDGGAGFIGSHLVDRLIKDGHKVIVLDDFSEGKRSNLTPNKNLTVFKGSILNLDRADDLFYHVDVVFHLAALTRPLESIEEPLKYNRTNVEGTLNVLQKARENKVKRVVLASSASVYGEQKSYPCKETSVPNPMSPYASQKLMCEEYCKLYTRIYGLETNCLRFFNAYGLRMNPDSGYSALIPGFIKKIKNGITPVIFGDGNQARDFVFVSDIVEGLIKASTCGTYGLVVNLGAGMNYSVNKVADLIYKELGQKNTAKHGPAVIEPTQTLADTTLAKTYLDWKPKISLEEGIKVMVGGY